MQPLTEEQVRRIVKEEMQSNYISGAPRIPPHHHDGSDNLNVDPLDLVGFSAIPTSTAKFQNTTTGVSEYGFGSPNKLAAGDASHLTQYVANPTVAQYPVPIVVGNGAGPQSAFEGGYAPEGTIVVFTGVAQPVLYVRWDGGWIGVALPLTA